MERIDIKIGLFGFGCVGNGLYEVLEKTPTLRAQIKKICIKDKNKKRTLDLSRFTFDKNELLNDPEINTIVELIDDADAAFEIVKTALSNGKAVVTANKKMIAEHFEELLILQKKFNVPLLYEAACCASIPIIRNLEEYFDNDLLDCIEGIVNGSTNFILTKTSEENISYESALLSAQEKGYAESNPIMDTGGFDAKFKLLILIAHAFGVIKKPEEIVNIGIDNLGSLDLNYAKEKGYKIKLIAHAEKNSKGEIIAFVMPKFVEKSDKLFSVDDVYNGIKLKSYFSDTQFFMGKGAGAYPTASAVLSDISALSYDYKYEYKKLNNSKISNSNSDGILKVFVRHSVHLSQEIKEHFLSIKESYQNFEEGFIIGNIEFSKLEKLRKVDNGKTSIILFDIINESIQEQNILDNNLVSLEI